MDVKNLKHVMHKRVLFTNERCADLLNMKNLMLHSTMISPTNKIDEPAQQSLVLPIPETDTTTTADRLLYLKDCLDRNLIDKAGFRSLRDELTYGRL